MTKPEDALVERLRQGVIVMGFGPGDQEMVDIVTANQAMRKAADAITTLLERERRATEALADLEQRATATLAAVDQYNEKNGTYIIGPILLQLGKSIAKARAALTGDGVQPDQTS